MKYYSRTEKKYVKIRDVFDAADAPNWQSFITRVLSVNKWLSVRDVHEKLAYPAC